MLRICLLALTLVASLHAADQKPLRALLVAGGCCHDYAKQHEILSQGIQARANVQVDVVWTDDKSVTPPLPLYDKPDWAAGYDIIIHDECAAGTKDMAVMKRILDVHKTVPAVHLHCAMHSFRTGTDAWFKHLGLQSASHGPQEPIAITFIDKKHPITKTLADWTTIKEELYNNVNIFDAHPLAMGKQTVKQKDGTTKDVEYIVAWTNEKQGAKSFSTTIGHNNDTVADARYLDLVTRGLLWACGKLNADYLTPFKGRNKVSFVKAEPKPEAPKPTAAAPPVAPKDATLVVISASSEEIGKDNYAWKAVDGSQDSRWCASSSAKPAWLLLEFEKPQDVNGIKILWESKNNAYQHRIEAETEVGKARDILIDATTNKSPGDSEHSFDAKAVKRLYITCTGTSQGGWASIREVTLKGPGIKAIAPKMSPQQKAAVEKAAQAEADPYKNQGNTPPRIVKLTTEEEQKFLSDVKVPEGFEVSLFAPPQTANYPVFVAAAPDGTLYVSSDGNGSLGRNPHRGRILRLRDTDHDGRADEVKEFVKDIDAPRGLVWDHDRLYLVHPPHLSAFIDKDGDGVSDEQKVLVKNIAFGYDKRPADHTTNGLSLGIDGWLYIAGGDFGFMDAEGTDGRKLTHRGGGVIRVRPDGTSLEIYATGTRNILEVAVSPTMDIFARDNTNDGGGWNVRFHHFTGFADHGYPRLYKNFGDEIIQPLADYGGGSGCGATYLDEPGFGAWNNAPLTADWGTGALWRHKVKAKGAAYEETEPPQPFIKMTRPTDGDVDAMGHVYCASWKGATFNWEGPDVGYIVSVRPKGFKAETLPDFGKATNTVLVALLESPSSRRRLEAQRELIRRKLPDDAIAALTALVANPQKPLPARTAALLAFTHFPEKGGPPAEAIKTLPADPAFDAIIARAIAETAPFNSEWHKGELRLSPNWASEPAALAQLNRAIAATPAWNAATRKAVFDLTLGNADPVVQHTAIQSLATLKDEALAFQYVDDAASSARTPALRALAKMHTEKAVEGLLGRLNSATASELRQGFLSALCRLHFHEGVWTGDSWGTRPDTRGPYYQPEAWSETPRIMAALKDALAKATPEEAAFLVREMNRNRIQSNEALERILTLAAQDSKLVPEAVAQLANSETIPVNGMPLLLKGLTISDNPTTLSQAITALAKTDSAEACRASLNALVALSKIQGAGKELEAARTAFLNAPKLENHHQLLEAEAEKVGEPRARWADIALLTLSQRKEGSPEARELSQKALDTGWTQSQRRAQIIDAIRETKAFAWSDKVLAAVNDADPKVAKAAQNAVKQLKLQPKESDKSPLISTLKPDEVVAAVLKTHGDVGLGEQLFTRQTCIACHTTKESDPPKGPYLGNIAQTYKRPELALNIIDPNKTMAQGFASEVITLKDGTQQMGFITLESADNVKLRNVAAQEFTFAVKDIKERQKLPISIMPPGLVNNLTVREFASLLDYLEALAKK